MLTLLRDLVAHKGHANAALLTAIRRSEAATADAELRTLLHHILVSNRYWLLLCVSEPFVSDAEMQVPDSLDALIARFRTTHLQELGWLASIVETDLDRSLESPLIPAGLCSVSEALMQVCLHSHGHRAQCAKMLRRLGGSPPATDFILWLTDRASPEWPDTAMPRGR